MPNIRSQVISNADLVNNMASKMSIGSPDPALSPTFGFTSKLKKKSTHMASSGLENAATERTSAMSKAFDKAFLANTLSKAPTL